VKGFSSLIDAMESVIRHVPNMKLILVGDGSERKRLHKQIRDRRLVSNILCLGLREDVPEILSSGDVFILSSLNEGFGIVLLEAMAFRLPIVATRVGGVSEVVEDGQTGLLVSPGTPDAMANAILNIYNNREWGRAMGLAGYDRLNRMFDIRKIIGDLDAIYMSLLNHTKANPERPEK